MRRLKLAIASYAQDGTLTEDEVQLFYEETIKLHDALLREGRQEQANSFLNQAINSFLHPESVDPGALED